LPGAAQPSKPDPDPFARKGVSRRMTENLQRLLEIMARLRDPERGCPWDVQQSFATIAPYTIEEAYEVADAIARGDRADLREELGDLLLQVVFHARMAEEERSFDFDDVARAIADKLVRRHPHVFDGHRYDSEAEQKAAWEHHKARERASKADAGDTSALADLPLALPALLRAAKLGKRAARTGFDWPDVDAVLDKVHEEIGELRDEITETPDPARIEDELGDLLFACAQLGRHLGVDPDLAAIWVSTPRPPCAAPTPVSSAASARSRRRWRPRGARRPTQKWTSWSDCGRRPSERKAARKAKVTLGCLPVKNKKTALIC